MIDVGMFFSSHWKVLSDVAAQMDEGTANG